MLTTEQTIPTRKPSTTSQPRLSYGVKFNSAQLLALTVATEAVELLWVGLNLMGIEGTVIDANMQSVADIHLVHMPFSHSIATSIIFAAFAGLLVRWFGGGSRSAAAIAVAIGAMFHIVLDLAVHASDIALAPFLEGGTFGTGLMQTCRGLRWHWKHCGACSAGGYTGGMKNSWLVCFMRSARHPNKITAIDSGIGGASCTTFCIIILAQILPTGALYWLFAKGPQATSRLGAFAA